MRVQIQCFVATALCGTTIVAGAIAANCDVTTVNKTALTDLGLDQYLSQFEGGLYPGGSNLVPEPHATVGMQRAAEIQPLDVDGKPGPAGKYILLSIGMSNTTQEFSTFRNNAAANPAVNQTELKIIDGAAGGQAASTWDDPNDQNYNRIRDTILLPQGLSEAQVQIAWVKVANAGPSVSLPNANADAYMLLAQQGNIARALRVRYPNLKLVFFSSRIYAGYASTALNPEPYAYESAFGVKWLIEAQIDQMNGAGPHSLAGDLDYNNTTAWLAWGPYLWADGLTPRSDSLIWECANLNNDGTHPSTSGRQKVANMLMTFFLHSPFTKTWFRADAGKTITGDVTGNGSVGVDDLLQVINQWGPCPPAPAFCPADVHPDPQGDDVVNVDDLLLVINNWG